MILLGERHFYNEYDATIEIKKIFLANHTKLCLF